MRLVPRSYQTECVDALYQYFGEHAGNPLCALPTGTGKSVVIAMFLESVYRAFPTQKILILVHVKELVQQNYRKLIDLWPGAPAGINSAGLRQRDVFNRIIFASIGSVAKHADKFGHVDLIIIDEAHLVSPTQETMYRRFVSELLTVNPHLKVIGFTATPWRSGVGKLTDGGLFTDVAFDITTLTAFNRLIAEGYLAPLIPKRTSTMLSVDGVHIRGGDFVASELQLAVDVDHLTERAIREAMELGHDRRHWLAFCAGVEHAIHTADAMNAMGVSAVAVHSKMTDTERDDAIAQWQAGRYVCAVNNNVLTTGIDFPAIDLILMLRPTASSVLWVQMLGRGTRPFSCAEYTKENCLVLDYAGNTKRLGPINDPVLPRKRGQKGGDAPIRLCEQCGTYNHASVRVCMNCGYEFPRHTKLKQEASNEELIKGSLPEMQVFKIDHITFSRHDKVGSPPSMRVNYYCGIRMFNEFVCFEHQGYARRRAVAWWMERAQGEAVPDRTDDALVRVADVRTPTHLRVWVNKKYPEIMAHCFDGTAFGAQDANDAADLPTVDIERKEDAPLDDDIPF